MNICKIENGLNEMHDLTDEKNVEGNVSCR